MNLTNEIWAQVVAEVQAAAAERQSQLSSVPRMRNVNELGKDGWYAVRKPSESGWKEIWAITMHNDNTMVSFKDPRGTTMGPMNAPDFVWYQFFGPLQLPE